MAEFDYSQRRPTKEWDKGHESLYGKRCIKHRSVRIDEKPCDLCEQEAQVKRITEKKK